MATLAAILITLGSLARDANGVVWLEVGDASDNPQIAQLTTGVGTLDQIQTTLGTAIDSDSFQFRILDASAFSVNLLGTNLSGDNDTEIYITDIAGNLIFANDDFDGLLSGLSAGSFPGPSGDYVFSVNLFSSLPIGDPITGFSIEPNPVQTGPVVVNFTGAGFAVIPESSSAFLILLGGLRLTLRRSRTS